MTDTNATLIILAEAIKANLKDIGAKTFETGALLLEAKDSFDKSSEFLSWSLTEVGLKKSQTYKLMKIATTFSEDVELQGLSATVLYTLTTATEEVLDTVRRAVSDGGLVTSDALEGILFPVTITVDGNTDNEEEGDSTDKEEEEETPLQKKINKEVQKAVSKVEKAHAKTTAKLDKVEADKDALIKEKRKSDKALILADKAKETTQQKLDKALEEVKELKAQLKELTKALK